MWLEGTYYKIRSVFICGLTSLEQTKTSSLARATAVVCGTSFQTAHECSIYIRKLKLRSQPKL